MELDGRDARGFLDLDGVHVGIYIGLHHGHAQLVLDAVEGLDERGGLSAAGGGHKVQEVDSLAFELPSQIGRVFVIVGKDAFFYLYDLDRIHGNYLSMACTLSSPLSAPSAGSRYQRTVQSTDSPGCRVV